MTLAPILAFASSLGGQTTKNILVLHMEGQRLPANQVASKAIQEVLGQDPKNQIFEEYLDENRLGLDSPKNAATFEQKYKNQKMDLILTVGPEALRFMLRYRDELWPDVPIVFSVLDSRSYPANAPANVTGVSGSLNLSKTVDLILRLQPDVRRIFYVGGASPGERGLRQLEQRQDFVPYSGKVEFEYLDGLAFPQLLERLSQLPDHSAVLYVTYFRDQAGQPFVPVRICPSIVGASVAPVYGTFETYLGCGIVGGAIFNVEASARQAAMMGQRILQGESVANLPVEPGPPNMPVVDWRQLKRWNIAESRLPAGVTVLYREPTPWERYRKFLLLMLAFFIFQTTLIILLVIETVGWRRSDRAVRRLTNRLISGNEEERRRIARELHDDVGQRLSLISSQLVSCANQVPQDAPGGREELNDSIREMEALINDVHDLSHQLHSSKLEILGLPAALKDLCRQISARHHLPIELETQADSAKLPGDISLCLYRVAQEALNNVIKHSGTDRVEVSLSEEHGKVSMQIRDFGVGFRPGDARQGLGLAAMRERLRMVQGELTIRSKPGDGTLVAVEADALRNGHSP